MADLLDIAPATSVESVKITNGQRLVVRGLNSNDIAAIAGRFPELVRLLAGGDNLVPNLIANFGAAIGPIIAASCGHLGDERAEQIAAGLLVEDQIKLLKAIVGLMFPNGFGAVMNMIAIASAPGPAKTVRVRLKKSPSASPHSSAADFPPTMQ